MSYITCPLYDHPIQQGIDLSVLCDYLYEIDVPTAIFGLMDGNLTVQDFQRYYRLPSLVEQKVRKGVFNNNPHHYIRYYLQDCTVTFQWFNRNIPISQSYSLPIKAKQILLLTPVTTGNNWRRSSELSIRICHTF